MWPWKHLSTYFSIVHPMYFCRTEEMSSGGYTRLNKIVKYNYWDGETPGHTEHKLSDYKIFTIHNIGGRRRPTIHNTIALNILCKKLEISLHFCRVQLKNTVTTDSRSGIYLRNLLNQYSPVPGAQLDCWEGRYAGKDARVARAQIHAGIGTTKRVQIGSERSS